MFGDEGGKVRPPSAGKREYELRRCGSVKAITEVPGAEKEGYTSSVQDTSVSATDANGKRGGSCADDGGAPVASTSI